MAKIKLVEVKSDLGGKKAGASLGIDAIRIASYKNQDNFGFFRRFEGECYDKIEADNQLFNRPDSHIYCKKINELTKIYEQTAAAVAHGLKNCDFTIVLAGDHSTAGGTICGMRQAYPDKKIGVVWIDAHADVHTPYSSDTGNMHGMPVATVIDDDNTECIFNELDNESITLWEKIKNVGGIKKKVSLSDFVYVALRDFEIAETTIINKYNTKVVRTIDLRLQGANETAHQILKHLSYCDVIYVSFDVDALDTTVSMGTGTPFEGGLFAYEARQLLKILASFNKVKCIEIAEVNPTLDEDNKMAEVVFNIFSTICRAVDLRFAHKNSFLI
ncbi:MAG: arginase [Ignavibacteria bacterium]|nr:arginase [Ignavibacteria bacterium]